MITTLILWYLFASVSGAIEAILFSKKGNDAFKWNQHILFVIQRILAMIISIPLFFEPVLTLNQAGLLIGSAILSFSFWHDGLYYVTRSKIDVPAYNFTSTSETSTALIELPFLIRLSLFIFSIGLIVSIYEL